MDLEPSLATLKALLKRVPLLLKTAILNLLSLSPTGGKQNLRVELTVSMIRSFIDFSSPPGKAQRRSMKDPGVKGRMWISKVKAPRPAENDVLDALLKVVESLKEGPETYDVPELRDVEAEWTGFRSGVDSKAKEPDITEEEKYKRLMGEVKEDLTVLYFHGGAYHLMDPCTHRVITAKLARMTGGRCYSVRYRLAPQAPFPAAVLDALVSYLTLLSPPEGSLHSAVPANKIVFAGDSAGGGLSLALLQTLLTLRRLSPNPTIRFHGKDVPIELPAAAGLASPWCDVTRSLPSTYANEPYDYLAPPHQDTSQPYTPIPFPEDATWPISPPRVDFYANANTLIHPLVSPLAGPNELWKDTPPIYIAVGEESLEDDGVYFARKVHRAGGTAVLERFEGKPHCFALIFLKDRAAKRSFQTWTDFLLDAVKGGVKKTDHATLISHDGKKAEKRSLEDVRDLSDEEVQKRLKHGRDWRVEGENDLVKKWRESLERAKL